MLQIKRNQFEVPDAERIEKMRAEFAEKHCLLLPQFLEPALLEFLLKKLETTKFVTKFEIDHENEFGKVLFVPLTEPTLFIFHMLMNNKKLFQTIEEITGCLPIGNFTGRIHSSKPEANHHIEWHGDNADYRLIGLTMNLGTDKFKGGLFQLREKDSEKIVCEIGQIDAGDAFIFRIAPNLQHKLTAVQEGGSRTVGVGWFRSQPSWEDFSKSYFQR